MEKLDITKSIVHKTSGLLNFLGGSFNPEKVATMPFADVIEHLNRNGGIVLINLSPEKFEKGFEINTKG